MTDEQINQAFLDAWEEFGDDKSTEFLITITADRCGISYDDVVESLAVINDKDQPHD